MNTKLNFKQSIVAGLMAAGVATVINVILFFIFHAVGVFTDTIFVQPNQPLNFVAIIISSTLPTLIASMVFFLFERFTKNGFRIFSIVAIVLGIFSLASPFTIVGVTTGYALALEVMHIVVVGSLLFFIKRASDSLNSK